MLTTPILFTAEFLLDTIPLSWSDILWGYQHGVMGWRVPIDIAHSRLDRGQTTDVLEIELSQLGKDRDWRVSEIVEELALGESIAKDAIEANWLYLTVRWIYEHRQDIFDPLERIEEIYADFDYPKSIEPFVRFLPISNITVYDPTQHSLEDNQERLWVLCKEYLNKVKLRLEPKTSD